MANSKQIRTMRRYHIHNARTGDHMQPKINEHQLIRDVLRMRNNLSHLNNRMIHLEQTIDDYIDCFMSWLFVLFLFVLVAIL
jgi:hypothetical protein